MATDTEVYLLFLQMLKLSVEIGALLEEARHAGVADDVLLIGLYTHTISFEEQFRQNYATNYPSGGGETSFEEILGHMKTMANSVNEHVEQLAGQLFPNVNFDKLSGKNLADLLVLLRSKNSDLPQA